MLVALALVAACQMAAVSAATPTYAASNIVADVAKCPVKNVPFDKSVFDVTQIGGMLAVLQPPAVSEKCVSDAVSNLAGCAIDNSLAYSAGCCSKECAANLLKAINSGCFKQYASAVCSNPVSQKYQAGLFSAAVRCAGFEVACKGSEATITPVKASTAVKAAQNATAAAAASDAKAALDSEAAAPVPDSGAPAAPTPSSSQRAAGGVMVALAAVGGALLLQM